MTRAALLYAPKQRWRVAVAFGAALLIHFAAIALAQVHRVEKTSGPIFAGNFPEITFEEPPSIMAMTVDSATGNVSSVSMVKSTGSPFLDNAALNAFRRWRLKPGTISTVRCPITFTLTGAAY
jgi:TonB family protein